MELQKQAQEDELYRQVMMVHSETVDSFLEELVTAASDQVADKQARQNVRTYAAQIGAAASDVDERSQSSEAVVSQLMSSFLFPEVERRMIRQNGTGVCWRS